MNGPDRIPGHFATELPSSDSVPSLLPIAESHRHADAQQQPRRRLKLWELDHRFHCLAIGTCLTIDELRRLARKAGISVGAAMSHYELHQSFVQLARNPVFAARAMHKWLDRKFAAAVKRSVACRNVGELGALWDAASAAGDIAGAFWALVTHALAEGALLERIYGEVHMLSHLAGHSNHSARHELAMLKRRVAELEDAQARSAEAARLRIKDLERRAEVLSERAQRAEVLKRELAAAQAELEMLQNGEVLARLRGEKEALATQLEQALARVQAAEREARGWAKLASSAATVHPSPGRPTLVEAPAAAGAPEPATCLRQCGASGADDCPWPDLCGRRVLYVGGRNHQVAHFRALVERCRGEFIYHDGGLEDGRARLAGVLERADAVLCPIDCVSHDACLRVKKFCKQNAKTFVPLRTASLSAFIEGLQAVAV